MRKDKFKELTTNNTKHGIMWKIIKGELKVNSLDKMKNITKKQYQSILDMKEEKRK